jgi:uncharacterized protein (TIGR03790 family)
MAMNAALRTRILLPSSCLGWLVIFLLFSSAATWKVQAGGGGANVMVVVNQFSSNSVELGNLYAELRGVPPQNFLRLTNWAGASIQWTLAQFQTNLLIPLQSVIAARQVTNQIDVVLLSMDIPYKVGENSTTAALFYGFKTNSPLPPCTNCPLSCTLPDSSSNRWAGSEGLFRSFYPDRRSNFIGFMLTASNLPQARTLLTRAVAADNSFPTQKVILAKSTDVFRNIRYLSFDNTVFDGRVRGGDPFVRSNISSPWGQTNLLGFMTGLQLFSISSNVFVPGAMADSLTSYGGIILVPSDHTPLLAFLDAGAAGSYGTVVEPCAYLEKFPTPQNYFYQNRGFSLAESYYMSLTNPYQGILVGEPLCAPFARPAAGGWTGLSDGAVLSGTTNLALAFAAPDPTRPVQQVDLFVDGTWFRTLTNIPPAAGNELRVEINGHAASFTVPADATLAGVTTGLVAALNDAVFSADTGTESTAHGDRIEIQSTVPGRTGADVTNAVSADVGTAPASTTFLRSSRDSFLDTTAFGRRGCVVKNAPATNGWLALDFVLTNGQVVSVQVSNPPAEGTVSLLVSNLVASVNAKAGLQGAAGVVAEDYIGYDAYGDAVAEFSLRPRSAGWNAAGLSASLTGSPELLVSPTGVNTLEENLPNLRPRNHFHLAAGVTNLEMVFPLDTTALADGWHELAVVAHEGTHVRTQKRSARIVCVANNGLSASFETLFGGSNTLVSATLQFRVSSASGPMRSIELFSTGGTLGVSSNTASTTFAVQGSWLGCGLHPVHALLTTADGRQLQTETRWIRLVRAGDETAFPLSMHPGRWLSWPSVAGRNYDVLAASETTNAFVTVASFLASNSAATWPETNEDARRYYRVRSQP